MDTGKFLLQYCVYNRDEGKMISEHNTLAEAVNRAHLLAQQNEGSHYIVTGPIVSYVFGKMQTIRYSTEA